MEELTKQEIYDRVAEHLLTQNERCVSHHDNSCLYRNESGLKCAIGILIPDAVYRPIIETGGCERFDENADEHDAALRMVLISQGVTEKHFPMLSALQEVHDEHLPHEWVGELKSIRKKFKVKKHELKKTTRLNSAD